MIYPLLESQRQELSFWCSNLGNLFSRNYTKSTTVSWSDRILSRFEFLYTVEANVPICSIRNTMRQELIKQRFDQLRNAAEFTIRNSERGSLWWATIFTIGWRDYFVYIYGEYSTEGT